MANKQSRNAASITSIPSNAAASADPIPKSARPSAPVGQPLPTSATHFAHDAELIICIWTDGRASYQGSRIQLLAEGVIPEDTKWPDGKERLNWAAGGLEFSLSRIRPKGFKGPFTSWIEADHWIFIMDTPNQDWEWSARQCILEKEKALADERYRQSELGRRESDARWIRFREARDDKAFQAFKSTFVPQRKKPGRPARQPDVHAANK